MEYPAPFQNLYTAEGEALSGTPWEDYPRPQLRRKDWLCLNGDWDFSCESGTGTIRVPFCPESLLSGFLGRLRYGETLRYSRRFTLPAGWINRRVLLHFGAVSRVCEVFLNGKRLGSHDNAYLPFSFDASEALLPGENLLELSVVNDLSPRSPIGKQREKRGGMWYTPVSGVWQCRRPISESSRSERTPAARRSPPRAWIRASSSARDGAIRWKTAACASSRRKSGSRRDGCTGASGPSGPAAGFR